jgi:hypothetical protein
MFDLSFDEISPLVDRSPTTARQLASSARCRIQGAPTATNTDLTRQREVVDAFPAASRAGDFDGPSHTTRPRRSPSLHHRKRKILEIEAVATPIASAISSLPYSATDKPTGDSSRECSFS